MRAQIYLCNQKCPGFCNDIETLEEALEITKVLEGLTENEIYRVRRHRRNQIELRAEDKSESVSGSGARANSSSRSKVSGLFRSLLVVSENKAS